MNWKFWLKEGAKQEGVEQQQHDGEEHDDEERHIGGDVVATVMWCGADMESKIDAGHSHGRAWWW